MPDNVREQNVIWRCEECIREDGPTKCSYAIYNKKAEERTSYIVKKKICENNKTNWEDVYSHSRNDTINGNETGRRNADILEKKMIPGQIIFAIGLAQEWAKKFK